MERYNAFQPTLMPYLDKVRGYARSVHVVSYAMKILVVDVVVVVVVEVVMVCCDDLIYSRSTL